MNVNLKLNFRFNFISNLSTQEGYLKHGHSSFSSYYGYLNLIFDFDCESLWRFLTLLWKAYLRTDETAYATEIRILRKFPLLSLDSSLTTELRIEIGFVKRKINILSTRVSKIEYLYLYMYTWTVYNILTLRYSSILSSCNSKIILGKNL